jgi:hypothetical protein
MESEFNAFKKEPAGKPIKTGKTEFSSIGNIDSNDARIAAIMGMKKNK